MIGLKKKADNCSKLSSGFRLIFLLGFNFCIIKRLDGIGNFTQECVTSDSGIVYRVGLKTRWRAPK